MTGYMGYNPELLHQLRNAMARAADELDTFRSSDAEAMHPMINVAACRTALRETWIPLIDSLFSCRALEGYQPVGRVELPEDDWVRMVSAMNGWPLVSDPLNAADSLMTPEEARALAWSISHGRPFGKLDDHEQETFRRRLAVIASRAELVDAFVAGMDCDAWTSLLDDLAAGLTKHRRRSAGLSADLTAASMASMNPWSDLRDGESDRTPNANDGALADLARIIASRRERAALDLAALVADARPSSAALFVSKLALGAEELADVSVAILTRNRVSGWIVTQDVVADPLFGAMLATAGAPTAFLVRIADDPSLLFSGVDDPQLANRVMTVATDPAVMRAAQARIAIPPLIRFINDNGEWMHSAVDNRQLFGAVAAALAPYLLQIVRATPDGFDLTSAERSRILHLLVDHDDALKRLLHERDRVAEGVRAIPDADRMETITALRDFSELLALVDKMSRQNAIDASERAQQMWGLMWTALGTAMSLIPAPAPVGMASGPALTMLSNWLVDAGIGPQRVADVRRDTLREYDTITSVAAATVAAACFDQLVRAGRIPADVPPPPLPDLDAENTGTQYTADFEEWLADGNFDDETTAWLYGAKNAVLSPHEALGTAAEVLLG